MNVLPRPCAVKSAVTLCQSLPASSTRENHTRQALLRCEPHSNVEPLYQVVGPLYRALSCTFTTTETVSSRRKSANRNATCQNIFGDSERDTAPALTEPWLGAANWRDCGRGPPLILHHLFTRPVLANRTLYIVLV